MEIAPKTHYVGQKTPEKEKQRSNLLRKKAAKAKLSKKLREWYMRGQKDMYEKNDPKTSPNHRYRSDRANASPDYFTRREDPNKGGVAIERRKRRERNKTLLDD